MIKNTALLYKVYKYIQKKVNALINKILNENDASTLINFSVFLFVLELM